MKILITYIFLCFSFIGYTQQLLEWEVFHPIKKTWMKIGQSGSIQEMLIASGELPDPFYGENEKKFTWIENYLWQYRSLVTFTSKDLEKRFIEIEFPYVDTYCKIYLNDTLLLETSNAFVPHRVQVKELVHEGINTITAVFTPPILKHNTTKEETEIFYPAPNDVGTPQVAPLVRKPQYQFGWDWALRMNTIGFLKPVNIFTYDFPRILVSKIETQSIINDTATMQLSMFLSTEYTGTVLLESQRLGNINGVQVDEGKMEYTFDIEHPIFWWPRGQGDSHLYEDRIILKTSYGKIMDTVLIRFGVRTSELVQEKDSIGTSYYFKINKRPIFCKGANYIPQDVFPSRVNNTDIEKLVLDMLDANFNIVRVWGGGYYPNDYFFELCDRYGIMVWQDMMFACAMYPADELFLDNVRRELQFQIPRISAHPSVIQFNGNNEVEVAWKNWGFQNKYAISEQNQVKIQEDYLHLFKGLIPDLVRQYSFIPYVHTSPLGHWTNQNEYPHGTQHYWGVWHGKDKMEDFGKKSGRFNAEYGFQSFPEFSTLLKFSSKKDWDLKSPIMKNHQKSYVGNGMIKKHADLLFGEAKSFEEFVYFSQLTQAKAVSIAISAHRLSSPICMGTIFWQLNDCWPAPTWSSIDYYGNWKALQYQVKEDYNDVTLLQKTDEIGKELYYFVSDQPLYYNTTLSYKLFDLTGNMLTSKSNSIQVTNQTKIQICKECQDNTLINTNYYIEFEWDTPQGEKMKRSFSHIGNKAAYKTTPKDRVKLELTHIDLQNKSATLKIKNESFLNYLWISNAQSKIKYNKNFVSFLPGEHEIEIHFEGEKPLNEHFLMYWL